jgi:hypothetical protein
VRFNQLGIKPDHVVSGANLFLATLGISFLIAGATVLTRLPRLAVGRRWFGKLKKSEQAVGNVETTVELSKANAQIGEYHSESTRVPRFIVGPFWLLVGLLSFLLGSSLYLFIVPIDAQNEFNAPFESVSRVLGNYGPTAILPLLALLAALLGLVVLSAGLGDCDRQKRWLFKGMRPLILFGAAAVSFIVFFQLREKTFDEFSIPPKYSNNLSEDQKQLIAQSGLTPQELSQVIESKKGDWFETLKKVQPILVTQPPLWPVILASIAFLYLWWLATLIFDLAFVWHRYIRQSVSNRRLRDWNRYGLDPAQDDKGSWMNRVLGSNH